MEADVAWKNEAEYVTQSDKTYLLAQSSFKKLLVFEQLQFCYFMNKLNNI